MTTIQEYENAVNTIKRMLEIVYQVRGDLARFSQYANQVQTDPVALAIAQSHFTPTQIQQLVSARAWANARLPELDNVIQQLGIDEII